MKEGGEKKKDMAKDRIGVMTGLPTLFNLQ